jgi:UDP:flavonoid glycosyltransferase YjiC (YdhE family)
MNSIRKRILFIGEGVCIAHVVRPLVLAQAPDKLKYDVIFASGSEYKDIILKTGIKY